MGGSIGVTIRDPNGKWHKMDRWTNPTSYVFTSSDFLNGGKELSNYLKTWYEMCDEYDAWVAAGKPENINPRMSACYCSPDSVRDLLAPVEYGLIYIDFVKKNFWHGNGYTNSFDKISIVSVEMQLRQGDEESKAWVEDVLSRVIGYGRKYVNNDKQLVEERSDVKINSIDKFNDFIRGQDVHIGRMGLDNLYLDTNGWNYQEFLDSKKGMTAFLEAIQEEVELTSKEVKAWKRFMRNR